MFTTQGWNPVIQYGAGRFQDQTSANAGSMTLRAGGNDDNFNRSRQAQSLVPSQFKGGTQSAMERERSDPGPHNYTDSNFGDVTKPRYFGKEPTDAFIRRMMEQDPFCEIVENMVDSESDFEVDDSIENNYPSLKQQSKTFHKTMMLH